MRSATEARQCIAEGLDALEGAALRIAAALDSVLVAEPVHGLIIPPEDFAWQGEDDLGAYPDLRGGRYPGRYLSPEEVAWGVHRAQQELRDLRPLLDSWRLENDAEGQVSGHAWGARYTARRRQLRGTVTLLLSPYAGLYLPLQDGTYTNVMWTTNECLVGSCDFCAWIPVRFGEALLPLLSGQPELIVSSVKEFDERMRSMGLLDG